MNRVMCGRPIGCAQGGWVWRDHQWTFASSTAARLMVVRVWLPPTLAGVDPEAQVSARVRHGSEAPGSPATRA